MSEHPRLHAIPGGRQDERGPATPEPLWREVLGEQLRTLRRANDETLAETSERAGISPQYLSEVERGRKEPSSEMIAALAGALGISLAELTERVTGALRAGRRVAPRSAATPTLRMFAA